MRTLSIRQKLMLITMTSTTVALLLIATSFLIYEDLAFRQTLVQDLTTQARLLAERSTAALTFNDASAAEEYLSALADREHVVAACFYAGTNRFAEPYFRAGNSDRMAPLHPGPEGWAFSRDALVGFQPIQLSGETIGWIYLKSDLGELRARLWNYAENLGVFGLIALLATYLLAARLQNIISRPISNLAETARTVTEQKNYSVRAQKESDDELGRLIDGFNEMLQQIQRRDDALRHINRELEHRVEDRTLNLQQQVMRINLLNEITYAVAKRQDLDSITLITLQYLEDKLPVDYSSAYFYDAGTETFKLIQRGPKSRPVAERLHVPDAIPLAHTLFGPCLRGEIVYLSDARQSEASVVQTMATEGFHSILASPLMVEAKTFGVLVVHRRQKDGFTTAERDFFRGLSAHVALAVHQARLHQDLQAAYDEVRRTQQTVMQQERLKALGQMASGIAHDINNALSPIVGFADLIGRTEPDLSEVTLKNLRYIRTAGEDIAHIVARLREFYRPRGDRESLAMVNLNEVIEQAVGMTRPRWRDIPQSRGVMVEMQKDLDPAVPEFAGIETEIRESLTNLIINAVDAMPSGGVITIRTRALFAGAQDHGPTASRVVLEVSDNGVGMDEATRRRCLEPFFSTKGHRGTGLGLAMVYGVIERHGGQIEIESDPGKGTTVRLVFPVSTVETSEDVSGTRSQLPGSFYILCVDDEPMVRELLKAVLVRDGHKVEVADGGRTGIESFRAARGQGRPFDVVITDLGMPYVDGREVAATVKRESPVTPVVMLTGWGAFMREDGSVPPQVDGILSKPPRVEEIRSMLRQVTHKVEG